MSNNLDAPNIKYVKWMKWSLNRINYYYKTLYTNLHYFNVSVGQCERHLSNSIDYCKYYQPSMDTLVIESPLACNLFCLLTRIIIIIWYTNIYIYIYYVCKIAQFFYISLSISQSIIIIWYDNLAFNLALYDDRTLVIRITMYECIFVMLTELRTGGGA